MENEKKLSYVGLMIYSYAREDQDDKKYKFAVGRTIDGNPYLFVELRSEYDLNSDHETLVEDFRTMTRNGLVDNRHRPG